jgi:hypothetical protein
MRRRRGLNSEPRPRKKPTVKKEFAPADIRSSLEVVMREIRNAADRMNYRGEHAEYALALYDIARTVGRVYSSYAPTRPPKHSWQKPPHEIVEQLTTPLHDQSRQAREAMMTEREWNDAVSTLLLCGWQPSAHSMTNWVRNPKGETTMLTGANFAPSLVRAYITATGKLPPSAAFDALCDQFNMEDTVNGPTQVKKPARASR